MFIPMKPTHLVLFDIDGTLISTKRAAWAPPFSESIEEAWKEEVEFINRSIQETSLVQTNVESYRPGGKTDTQIIFELLEGSSLTEENIFKLLPAIREKYLGRLRKALADPAVVEIKPGIEDLLTKLSTRSEIVLSLLTGNFEEGARIKLGVPKIDQYFKFETSAFGDFAKQRQELPARAVAAAKKQLGLDFLGKNIVIIGDTPNDVRCGRHLNVRTIAVATSNYSMEDLGKENPDYLFQNLTETDKVVSAILEPLPRDKDLI